MQACDFHQCARTAGLKDADADADANADAGSAIGDGKERKRFSRKEERCGRETQDAALKRWLPKPNLAIQRRN